MRRAWLLIVIAACGGAAQRPFPLRDPLTVDDDMKPFAHKPAEYFSPFAWDQIDSSFFAPLSHVLSARVENEAANYNALDEVADSSWFTNRIGVRRLTPEELALGACKPEDFLPSEHPPGAWVIDHGKDNGSSAGFRIKVEGKGKYLLKGDESAKPERNSAAAVIGAALYHAAGYNTTCEQIVEVTREELTLKPNLVVVDNRGFKKPFDEAALRVVLSTTTQHNGASRMQASKWLDGKPLGPFRYAGTRDDDFNDVVPHEDRRELRGSRLLAAWVHHWDAREQNSMDMWVTTDPKDEHAPGFVRHYLLDTSDIFGQTINPHSAGSRLGFSYIVDFGDMFLDLFTLGVLEHPWDRVQVQPKREKFGFFSTRDFDPETWVGAYPNQAFIKATERDDAWMARIIARFTEDDLRALIATGHFADPGDAEYLLEVLLARQKIILARYLTRLSPLADVIVDNGKICALDLARLRHVLPDARFRYRVTRGGAPLDAEATPDAHVCFTPPARGDGALAIFTIDNGTGAGPLEIHTYDTSDRGFRVVGLVRPEPR
ncbi:MAG TPA: hypothetical protein VL463_35265 [Kofleriaceae bacterium]|jgi:hypothetical protein|nr:hypothetical protein [Kofleriaceae bacterium]